MKKRSRLAAALLLAAALFAAPRAQAAPRLLLVVSVDQMRGDYLDRFGAEFAKGLKTLFEKGAVWTKAHYAHVPTETGPGHSVILTGKHPSMTGIIGNDWWDAARGREVYNVDDSVHKLGPENLMAYTLGDALKAKSPASFVVALSHKDRGAILLGGKRPDAALWFDKKTGDFVTSSYYGAKPIWLDEFNAKNKAGPLASFGGNYKKFLETPGSDRPLLELAKEAVVQYGLGSDEAADILAVSFSVTDYVGHKHGPDSPELKAQLMSLDAVLGELLSFLESKVGKDGLSVALTADHGVMPLPESPAGRAMGAKRIRDEEFGERFEKTLQALHPRKAQKWVKAYYHPNVYLNRELARAAGLEWAGFLKTAAGALEKVEGVEKVYIPGEWDASDPHVGAYMRGYMPGRSGDLMVRQARTVLVAFDKTSTTHGSPYEYDTHVPLIFLGAGFKTGLFAKPAQPADLAPTCAKILGVDFPPIDGSRVLAEALAP